MASNSYETSGHVHFPVEQVRQHDSQIVVQPGSSECELIVHLGFLQVHHQYEIKFSIKDPLSEELVYDPLQNLYVKITGLMPSEDGEGHDFMLDFEAHKEKLMQEELIVCDANDGDKKLKLILRARVLGKGKGTPALKSGIRCTGINVEEDSEASDWQGFD